MANWCLLLGSQLVLLVLLWLTALIRPMIPNPARYDAKFAAASLLSYHSLELVSLKDIQSLWAGYGNIYEVTARATNADAAAKVRQSYGDIAISGQDGRDTYALILKIILPPETPSGPELEGHLRKMISYHVEQNFYSIAPRFGRDLPMARCLSTTMGLSGSDVPDVTATLMTDLRPAYPIAGEKRAVLNEIQVHAALAWLSKFHRRSWGILPLPLDDFLLPPLEEEARGSRAKEPGAPVWLNGGYTYLATRRKEYAALANDSSSEWSSALCGPLASGIASVAEIVAQFLTPRGRDFESLIHGDVKSENLFTTRDGSEAAFYDFQYVGLGLGVSDLAKLFTCSVPVHLLTDSTRFAELRMGEGERRLLERYRRGILNETNKTYDWGIFIRHWETALVDWLRFQASWGFWGNTAWLEARVRSILKDEGWRAWLYEQHLLLDLEDRAN
ncbi:hypothetical protein GGS21DRAFT_535900 [Xylaria nigripes]|nr:hypothetical protein GGS21DRAFT_535900 [Xylaria nigripes]